MPDSEKGSSSGDYIDPPTGRERSAHLVLETALAPVAPSYAYDAYSQAAASEPDSHFQLGPHPEESNPADLPPSSSPRPSIEALNVGNRPQPGPTRRDPTPEVPPRATLMQRVLGVLPAWMRRGRAENMDGRPQPGPLPERSNPRTFPSIRLQTMAIEGAPHLDATRPLSPLFGQGEIDRVLDAIRVRVTEQVLAQAGRGGESPPPHSPLPGDTANVGKRLRSASQLTSYSEDLPEYSRFPPVEASNLDNPPQSGAHPERSNSDEILPNDADATGDLPPGYSVRLPVNELFPTYADATRDLPRSSEFPPVEASNLTNRPQSEAHSEMSNSAEIPPSHADASRAERAPRDFSSRGGERENSRNRGR